MNKQSVDEVAKRCHFAIPMVRMLLDNGWVFTEHMDGSITWTNKKE